MSIYHKKTKREFDRYIRQKASFFVLHQHQIKPPLDFKERVMSQVERMEGQNRFWDNAVKVSLIFSPLLVREVWLLIRHDYFSMASMPFKDIVVAVYGFFVSGLAFNVFLFAGIFLAVIYVVASRRWLRLKFFAQIFNQARFRT